MKTQVHNRLVVYLECSLPLTPDTCSQTKQEDVGAERVTNEITESELFLSLQEKALKIPSLPTNSLPSNPYSLRFF